MTSEENAECKSISSEEKQVVKYEKILSESKNKLENKKERDAVQTIWDGVNNDDALIEMGNCFEHGIIMQRDLKVAEVFYRKTEKLGSQEARNRRNRLLAILSTYETYTEIPFHRTIPLRTK